MSSDVWRANLDSLRLGLHSANVSTVAEDLLRERYWEAIVEALLPEEIEPVISPRLVLMVLMNPEAGV